MRPPRPGSIDELLLEVPPRVRRLAEGARERIRALVPGVEERLRPGWGLIGYEAGAYFALVRAGEDHVRIGFEWGVLLPDPEGLLEGSGRQVRHVTIRTLRQLRSPALAVLIREAAALKARAWR